MIERGLHSVVVGDVWNADLPKAALVYADPPYDSDGKHGIGGMVNFTDVVARMTSLLEPDGVAILHCPSSKIWEVMQALSKPPRVFCWPKPGSMLNLRNWLRFQYGWEPIIAWGGPEFSWREPDPESNSVARWDYFIAKSQQPEQRGHPTPKPTTILRPLLGPLALPGRRALDLFCGSGTAAVLLAEFGMEVVAVDRNPRWCELTANRLAQEVLV